MNCPYCDIHIDEHEASRCLRGWVAREVMGWEVIDGKDGLPAHAITDDDDHIYLLPDLGPQWYPDIEILAAWDVVKKFGGGGFVTIQGYLYDGRTNYWYVGKRGHIGSRAEAFPLAICRAAIKVIGVDNDKT